MSSPSLTAGGLAISLAATGYHAWKWWKTTGRKPRDLVPFAGSAVLGGLSTICAGLLGVLAGWTVGVDNGLGKQAVSGATGTGGAAVHHGTAGQLSPGGAIVTFLLAFAFVVAWKAADKVMKQKLFWGWFSGATLTFTVGVAGLFLHVVHGVNGIGDPMYAWFDGGAV